MNIFIAYRFSGSDKRELRNLLEKVSESIEKYGHSTFIHFRDVENWKEIELEPGKVLERVFLEIGKSDAVLALVTSTEKSEGMLLEVGCAKGKGKKLILAIKVGAEAPLLKKLADVVVEFDTVERLVEMIPENI
ncbi:MAG: nucleoside 2-deoxyribosyltransferase [Candidatus Pacebacteria bacterium]|nr:nucleoside 2-deoxyribosyltransferase [Candidatus Paceibacterota bacterium]MDR3583363.1 nucleoside 2-deoxyribosyltransferase [Candidatus Paceibacterota bacterium]